MSKSHPYTAVLNHKGEICGMDRDPEMAWFQARSFYHMNNEQLRQQGFCQRSARISFKAARP